jgi:glycosyltransferase involved in cell wall biosynthesis
MPVYQPEKYPLLFAQSLDSIFYQDYVDWELIIVIDEDNLGTYRFVKKAVGQRSSVKVLMSKHNNGPGIARNIGTKYTTGKYIIFHDADDYSEKNRFSLLVDKIESCESKIVGSSFYEDLYGSVITPRGRRFQKLSSKVVSKHAGTITNNASLIDRMKVPFHFPTAIIDKEFLYRMGGFEPIRGAVDVVFIMKACLFHELCMWKEIPIVDSPLYHWCRHRSSITKGDSGLVEQIRYNKLKPLKDNKDKILASRDEHELIKLLHIHDNLSDKYDYTEMIL